MYPEPDIAIIASSVVFLDKKKLFAKKIIKQQKQIIKNDKTEEKGICTSFHVPPLLAIAWSAKSGLLIILKNTKHTAPANINVIP